MDSSEMLKDMEWTQSKINGMIRELHRRLNKRVHIELAEFPFQTFKDGKVDSDTPPSQQYISSLSVDVVTDARFPESPE